MRFQVRLLKFLIEIVISCEYKRSICIYSLDGIQLLENKISFFVAYIFKSFWCLGQIQGWGMKDWSVYAFSIGIECCVIETMAGYFPIIKLLSLLKDIIKNDLIMCSIQFPTVLLSSFYFMVGHKKYNEINNIEWSSFLIVKLCFLDINCNI